MFNKHFSTIGYKLGQIFGRVIDADQFPLKTTVTFRLTPVTEKFVYDKLLQLKPNKAIGLDKISSRLLTDGAEVIALILAKIMNCSFNSTSFPQSWKSAKVMALFKNGINITHHQQNYRICSVIAILQLPSSTQPPTYEAVWFSSKEIDI
jgi:hypothetical protein